MSWETYQKHAARSNAGLTGIAIIYGVCNCKPRERKSMDFNSLFLITIRTKHIQRIRNICHDRLTVMTRLLTVSEHTWRNARDCEDLARSAGLVPGSLCEPRWLASSRALRAVQRCADRCAGVVLRRRGRQTQRSRTCELLLGVTG